MGKYAIEALIIGLAIVASVFIHEWNQPLNQCMRDIGGLEATQCIALMRPAS